MFLPAYELRTSHTPYKIYGINNPEILTGGYKAVNII